MTDKYREMINQDFQDAPLTEAQKGEQAGTKTINEVRDTANKYFKGTEHLRRQHSPEAQKVIDENTQKYMDTKDEMNINDNFKFEGDQSNLYLRDKSPDAIQSLVTSIMNGSPQDHINYITQKEIAKRGMEGAENYLAENAGIGRSPAQLMPNAGKVLGGLFDGIIPNVQNYQQPIVTKTPQGGLSPQVQTTTPYLVPTAFVPKAPKADTKRLEDIGLKSRQEQQGVSQIQGQLPEMAQQKMKSDVVKAQAEQAGLESKQMGEMVRQAYLSNYADEQKKMFLDLANKKYEIDEINPSRVWENKSDMSKVMLMIGSGILGANGSNAGLQVIQNMVEKDIDAQKDKNLNQRSLIAKNYEVMKMLGMSHQSATKAIAESFGKMAEIAHQQKLAGVKTNPDVLAAESQEYLKKNLLALTGVQNTLQGTEKEAESAVTQAKTKEIEMERDRIKSNIDIRFKQLETSTRPQNDIDNMKSIAKMDSAKKRMFDLLKSKSPADFKNILANKTNISFDPEMERALQELVDAEISASGATGGRGAEKTERLKSEMYPRLLDAFSKGKYDQYLKERINKTIHDNMHFSKDYLADPIIRKDYPELLEYKIKAGKYNESAQRLKKESEAIKKKGK